MPKPRKRGAVRGVLALVFAAFLAGCATTANYEQTLNAWVGESADNLVRSWGAPTSTFHMPSGNDVYIYEHSESGAYTVPVGAPPPVQPAPGYVVPGQAAVTGSQVISYTKWCRTEFEISGGRIVRWNWHGNACRAPAPK